MTSPWTTLLAAQPLPSATSTDASGVVPLPSLGVIRLEGPDSCQFLQGQTTTDFREVAQGHVRRGAICSLKGRVLFSFIAIPEGENVNLVMPDDQIDAALLHLKKYAVFSKTTLSDERSNIAVMGVVGANSETLMNQLFATSPAENAVTPHKDGSLAIRIGSETRFLLLQPAQSITESWKNIAAFALAESTWWHAEITAGLATITAATRDLFQPQELNFHATHAVSYNKGCYTGQEIVARLYFRGKLKQRLYHLQGSASPIESSQIYLDDQPVGDVVMRASTGDSVDVLAVVKNSAIATGGLRLDNSTLNTVELPYPLPADKEE